MLDVQVMQEVAKGCSWYVAGCTNLTTTQQLNSQGAHNTLGYCWTWSWLMKNHPCLFLMRRKTEYLGENLLEHSKEPPNSAKMKLSKMKQWKRATLMNVECCHYCESPAPTSIKKSISGIKEKWWIKTVQARSYKYTCQKRSQNHGYNNKWRTAEGKKIINKLLHKTMANTLNV